MLKTYTTEETAEIDHRFRSVRNPVQQARLRGGGKVLVTELHSAQCPHCSGTHDTLKYEYDMIVARTLFRFPRSSQLDSGQHPRHGGRGFGRALECH